MRVYHGRGCGRSGNPLQGAFGAGRRIWNQPGDRLTHLRARLHRHGRGGGNDRYASDRGCHVRRFPRADYGSGRKPGRQGPLHVRGQAQSTDGHPHHVGGDAQHSQSLHAWVSHIPGLKVVLPSTPYDAKGLLKTAIRDDNPVVFFEDKMMYQLKGPVPEDDYTIPFGVADIKRPGTDMTIVATSRMVQVAVAAAEMLEKIDISAEVVDPRTTFPLDKDTQIESAKKTSRALVVDEGYERYGVTAEIASVIAEGAFYYLDAPVKRLGAMDVPVPFSPALEDLTVPTAASVVEMAKMLCGRV